MAIAPSVCHPVGICTISSNFHCAAVNSVRVVAARKGSVNSMSRLRAVYAIVKFHLCSLLLRLTNLIYTTTAFVTVVRARAQFLFRPWRLVSALRYPVLLIESHLSFGEA